MIVLLNHYYQSRELYLENYRDQNNRNEIWYESMRAWAVQMQKQTESLSEELRIRTENRFTTDDFEDFMDANPQLQPPKPDLSATSASDY